MRSERRPCLTSFLECPYQAVAGQFLCRAEWFNRFLLLNDFTRLLDRFQLLDWAHG